MAKRKLSAEARRKMSDGAKALWKRRPKPNSSAEARRRMSEGSKKKWRNTPRRIPTCHPDRRHMARGLCKPCFDADYAKRNRLKRRASNRRYNQGSKEQIMAKFRRKRYGLTPERFAAMIEAQEGLCAICRQPMGTPHVDHDHKTNQVRGLLCGNCNRGLGCFRENPVALERAISYLRLWQ